MAFQDTNVALGIPKKGAFQVGESDVDAGTVVERGVMVPFPAGAGTFVYFECNRMVVLDSGIVVHNRLPQVNNAPDTLSVTSIDDPKLDQFSGWGINLKCNDQYADIVQRMGHARYWVRLWGQALRLGYQVPIPSVKSIGGAPAIPYDKNPQWAVNDIAPGCSYGGALLWRAQWSLWYTTAVPPSSNVLPAADPTAQQLGQAVPLAPPSGGMQVPLSQADDDAVKQQGQVR